LNADDPFDGCDDETLPIIWREYPDVVCQEPKAIDARLWESGVRVNPLLPNIEFTPNGLKCCNRFGKICGDYEIRFCCPEGMHQFDQHHMGCIMLLTDSRGINKNRQMYQSTVLFRDYAF